jgi:hypothetical protein
MDYNVIGHCCQDSIRNGANLDGLGRRRRRAISIDTLDFHGPDNASNGYEQF